jgi:hypothetical protein
MTPPTGATAPVVAYDFTKWDPALTELQNVAAANQSGVAAYNITTKVGTASHGYWTTYDSGYCMWPYAASSDGACIRNSTVDNYWCTDVVDDSLLITGALTLEALVTINGFPGSGVGYFLLCGDSGETSTDNYLYSLGLTTSAVFTYFSEYGSGLDISIASPFACSIVPEQSPPSLFAITRQANGAVRFYLNGRRVSDLITPGGTIIPTYTEPHEQKLKFVAGYGTYSMLGARIFNTELTGAQIRESYNRTMFGYA